MRVIDISKFNYESKVTSKFFDSSFLLQQKDDLIFHRKKLKVCNKKQTI